MSTLIQAAAMEWQAAGHGEKRGIVEQLATELGCSVQTAYKKLREHVSLPVCRKKRSDAGNLTLSREEALWIATAIEETRRKTGNGALTIEQAVDILRENGQINAGRINEGTGEFLPLSNSAILRALRYYNVHPDQLAEATPATRLKSPHPNYCWQIDASISGQFYLADDGTRWMAEGEFYRGKPQNFARISDKRLWRYVVTDHCTGCIEVFYVLGAETSANLLSALIFAMSQRPLGTMYGIPKKLMLDPGSANKAGSTGALIEACGIDLLINKVGNARAKGQVENANKLVVSFEAMLKLRTPVATLEEINALAQEWSRHFNATRIHSRHKMPRRNAWLQITPDQLQIVRDVDALRQTAHSKPKPCQVRDCMVLFGNKTYDVRGVPGLQNKQKVLVVSNVLDAHSVRVLMPDPERSGKFVHYVVPQITQDRWGFLDTAATIGEEYKGRPETPADAARKEIDRLAMQVATDAEAAAARKAKRLAFNGAIDPMKHIRATDIPAVLPRAGSDAVIDTPQVIAARYIEPARIRSDIPPLNHVEAAMRLKPLVEQHGVAWCAAFYARTEARWPDGVPVEAVEAWALELVAKPNNGLQLVGGGQ